MSGPKTTWDDLAALGWPKQRVYDKVNEIFSGGVQSPDDVYLNEGLAAELQVWAFDGLIGDPRLISSISQETHNKQTAWAYDNLGSSTPVTVQHTESWTDTASANLRIFEPATIALDASITIPNVGATGLSLSIAASSTETEQKDESRQHKGTWEFEIGPHEKLTLIRDNLQVKTAEDYSQRYGIAPKSMIVAKVTKHEHKVWLLDLNSLIDNSTNAMKLHGQGTTNTHTFELIRETSQGKRLESLDQGGGRHDPLQATSIDLQILSAVDQTG